MSDRIYNIDCIRGSVQYLDDASVDLIICDPPFGIQEKSFDAKHYARKKDKIVDGYIEAPEDYCGFTVNWMREAQRVLGPDGSMFVVIGHTNLRHVLNAAHKLELHEVNHIIWKYNFGVNTRRKFVTSHYHVLYYAKSHQSRRTFNLSCRYGRQEKDSNNRSLLFADLEDVFKINKTYTPNTKRNKNKLPDDLISKLIQYCSNPDDVVADFFQGNFTTAIVAKGLGRKVVGFEKNKTAYDIGMARLQSVRFGEILENLDVVEDISPRNYGKPFPSSEKEALIEDYDSIIRMSKTKKEAISILADKYGRGRFSIINVLKEFRDYDQRIL